MVKLYRNLKPGDSITVFDGATVKRRSAVVTVTSVHETKRAWLTGKRQWQVNGNYPWWFPGPILAQSTDKTEYSKPMKERA